MKVQRFLVLALAGLALPACDASDPVSIGDSTGLTPAPVASVLSSVPGVQEVVGETGPGSTYALFRPANWNGELVVFAHGYVQPHHGVSLIPPSEQVLTPALRDNLLLQGFAFAHSSWSETDYAVKDGAQRTHQLTGLFDEAFGAPSRTYLVGLSLGALIANQLSEKFGPQYDGTLALCGVMAGGAWNARYVADFRVLFDYFYPGVLPGTLLEMPEGALVEAGSPLFYAIFNALATNPFPAMEMAGMDQIQLRYNSVPELIEGFIHVLGYQVNGANALTDRVNGKSFYDNTATQYSGSTNDAAVNAGVARYEGDPSAENYFDRSWTPAGAITRPFVTLHTTRDPLVPERGEGIFAARVDSLGNSGLLLQRTTDAFGHCRFDGPDVFHAFGSLVQWVRTGVKPAA